MSPLILSLPVMYAVVGFCSPATIFWKLSSLAETVRAFARDRVAPVAAELDHDGRFPYELVSELAELGFMGIPIPEEYEGAGGDTVSYALAVEELTRVDSSVAITMAAHTSLGT